MLYTSTMGLIRSERISEREILDRSECETVLEMTVTWLGTMARFAQDNSQFEICRLTINLKFEV